MTRELINYLPHIIREYAEYKAIMASEQPEFEAAWAAVARLLTNQFVMTADDLGLSRWEKMLDIVPKSTDTLSIRRARILARLNEQLPYSLRRLRLMLETLCGEGNCTAEIDDLTYILRVTTTADVRDKRSDVLELLERVVPENLVIDLGEEFDIAFYIRKAVRMPLTISITHLPQRAFTVTSFALTVNKAVSNGLAISETSLPEVEQPDVELSASLYMGAAEGASFTETYLPQRS